MPQDQQTIQARFRAKHKDRLAAKRKAHRAANKDKYLATEQAYRAAKRELLNAKARTYRQTHKEIIAATFRAKYAANKPKYAAKARAYNDVHKEEISVKNRRNGALYRAAHKAEIAAKKHAYREAHKAEINAKNAAWRAAHPGRDTEYRAANPEIIAAIKSRRRARKASAPINDLSAAQWREIKEHYDHRCVYCGRKMQRLTQDHLTPLGPEGPHTVKNVVPACVSCNSKKKTGPPLCPVQPLLLTIAPARKKKVS